MTKTVGAFTIKDGSLYGPKEYMDEQGNAKLDEILGGVSVVFNTSMRLNPHQDIETAILVALQTDYAGWKGTKQLLDSLK